MPTSSTEEIRRLLDEIPIDIPLIDQLLEVAGLLCLALRERGLRVVVVGGTAVAIYTQGAETTLDVDFVVQGARLDAIDCLRELGFAQGQSAGVWWYERLKIPVEIPDNMLAGDLDRVMDVQLENGLIVPVIGIDDLILDRAEQAAAQGSPSSDVRRQAILLMAAHWDRVDWPYVVTQAEKRGFGDYVTNLRAEAGKVR